MATYTTKHGVITIEGDESIERDLREHGEYMFSDIEACLPYVHGLVVDVGAHVGLWTLPMAQRADKVIAVEARKDTAQLLQKNIDANGLRNVVVINSLLGDPDKGYVQVVTRLSGCNHYLENETGEAKGETLDSLISEPVHFMKIDVEGMEPEVLKGARRILNDDKPALLIEINPRILKRLGRSPRDIATLLPGYTFYRFHNKLGWVRLWWLMDSFYNVLALPAHAPKPSCTSFPVFIVKRLVEKICRLTASRERS